MFFSKFKRASEGRYWNRRIEKSDRAGWNYDHGFLLDRTGWGRDDAGFSYELVCSALNVADLRPGPRLLYHKKGR